MYIEKNLKFWKWCFPYSYGRTLRERQWARSCSSYIHSIKDLMSSYIKKYWQDAKFKRCHGSLHTNVHLDQPEYVDAMSRNKCNTNKRFGALHHHQCNWTNKTNRSTVTLNNSELLEEVHPQPPSPIHICMMQLHAQDNFIHQHSLINSDLQTHLCQSMEVSLPAFLQYHGLLLFTQKVYHLCTCKPRHFVIGFHL